jgi:DNA-binding XRE family transcriptional regulator
LILEEENLVKKTCKELGITQKELAEKIGVSQNTVSTWKNNNQIPNLAIKVFELLKSQKECESYKTTINKLIFHR